MWSLLNRLDTLPAAAQPLLPKADSVVTRANSQNIATQTPADAPGDGFDIKDSGFPVICPVLRT